VRLPNWWYLGGLCALTLVVAPPTAGSTDESQPEAHCCQQGAPLQSPQGCCIAESDEMSASVMDSDVVRIQGESRPSLRSTYTTEHFTLSYTSDPNSPHAPAPDDEDRNRVPDYIERLGTYFEQAWGVFTEDEPAGMGYSPPPLKAGARYSILVYQLSPGYSGQTWADSKIGRRATSHISISVHLSEPYVRAVAAHELFHAIQFGYNYTASFWWKEASADWAAAEVFPEVDTYIIPYYDWFQVPGWSLDLTDGWHEYGSSIWVRHLALARGREIVRSIWAEQRAENDSFKATSRALEAGGTTFAQEFHQFALWNWFTGERSDGAHYPQGDLYPMHAPTEQPAGVYIGLSGSLRRVSSRYVPLVPPTGGRAVARGLTVRITPEEAVAAQIILERKDGEITTVTVTSTRYHIPDFEQNYRRGVLVLSNGDTANAHRYNGSTSLGFVYRDQYGYVWDLQISWSGAVRGTVDVGDTVDWTVIGEIEDGAFRWRAINPSANPGERWVGGFDVAGSLSASRDGEALHWTNDAGRADIWNGTAFEGAIPDRMRVDRRGPAQR
jgi:hypothetical protein